MKTIVKLKERRNQENMKADLIFIAGLLAYGDEITNEFIDDVTEEAFSSKRLRLIYRTMKKLHKKKIPINIYTVYEHLRSKGKSEKVGGIRYLNKLVKEYA